MEDADLPARDAQFVTVTQRSVGRAFRVERVPERAVGFVDEHRRRLRAAGEIVGRVDVVVVTVRADDRHDAAVTHRVDDRARVVRGVDDEHLVVVADEPDVVLDVVVLAVDREDPVRPDALDARVGAAHRQNTTTERSTSPRSILSNAASTWSSAIVSDTNRSRSNRPCR